MCSQVKIFSGRTEKDVQDAANTWLKSKNIVLTLPAYHDVAMVNGGVGGAQKEKHTITITYTSE